jgi:nucleoside-diphosphate-sugar epimerase
MKRAFVTGGSGFVGGKLIAALRARSIEVSALARSDNAARAVEALGATAVRGDLDDAGALEAGMRGCDVALHAAAHVAEHGPLADFMRINVGGTERVIAAARAASVKRLVHIGTEAVLADGKPIVRADETRPRTTRPAGPYPLTKGLAEAAVIAANGNGLDTVVVRPRFIWGKGDVNLGPKIAELARRGKFAFIAGGHHLTSTCHVDNVVEGALLAAERGTPGEIYFLSDGEPVEMRAFMTTWLAAQGVDAGTRSVPRWLASVVATLTSWMKQPPVTKTAVALVGVEVTVDDSKARRELGYTSAKSREAGLAEMKATSS